MTFIISWGIFCYTIMSFGLQNAGATHQKDMNVIFHDQIHYIMEV